MKRVRDERKIDRVELPGSVLLTGLLATIFGKAKSLRSATDSGVLAEGPLVKWLLKALRGRGDVVAHASTLHAFVRQKNAPRGAPVSCSERGQLARDVADATSCAGEPPALLGGLAGIMPHPVRASRPRSHVVLPGSCHVSMCRIPAPPEFLTVGGAVRGYLGFEVARVGEQQASRDLLEWVSSSHHGYGPRFIDVLLADALYCNQVDLSLFSTVATRG